MIRTLEISELDKLSDGVKQFFLESDMFRGNFNIEYFKMFWTAIYKSNVGIIFVLVDGKDEILGAIGGVISPDCITGILVSSEMFWYVVREYRGRGGLSLINRYEQWASEMGCKKMRMVHLSDLMPKKLKLFYEKRGYSEIETVYEKECP